jgi:hypothetical protein
VSVASSLPTDSNNPNDQPGEHLCPPGFLRFQSSQSQRRTTMNREILEQPFGPEQIKQREGNFGKILDYIEGSFNYSASQ